MIILNSKYVFLWIWISLCFIFRGVKTWRQWSCLWIKWCWVALSIYTKKKHQFYSKRDTVQIVWEVKELQSGPSVFFLNPRAARAFVVDATDQKAPIQAAVRIDRHSWLSPLALTRPVRRRTSIGSPQLFNMRADASAPPSSPRLCSVKVKWKTKLPSYTALYFCFQPPTLRPSIYFFFLLNCSHWICLLPSLIVTVLPPWMFLRLPHLRLSLSCLYAPLPPSISAWSSPSRSVDISGSLYAIATAQSAADPLLLGQC